MWGLAYAPDARSRRCTTRGSTATCAVNEGFADAVVAELEREPRRGGVLPRLPPLSRAEARARRGAGRALTHFIHIPWPEPDYWTCCRPSMRARDARRPACERRCRLAHEPLAAELPAQLRGHSRREVDIERRPSRIDGRTTLVTSHPIGVDPPSSTSCAMSDAVLAQERAIEARRPESSSCASTARIRRRTSSAGFRAFALFSSGIRRWHGRVDAARAARPVAPGRPEYADYLAAIERGGARRQRALSARRLAAGRARRSPTTSRSRSPRTSSTTCCS